MKKVNFNELFSSGATLLERSDLKSILGGAPGTLALDGGPDIFDSCGSPCTGTGFGSCNPGHACNRCTDIDPRPWVSGNGVGAGVCSE